MILLIAVIPALIVCLNFWLADLNINVWMDPGLFRLSIGIGITLLLLMMIITGIWYPARQAMKIQPATALREE